MNRRLPTQKPAAAAALVDDEATLSESDHPSRVEREYVFKVVVIGSYSTGKTTFVKRLLHAHLHCGGAEHHRGDQHHNSWHQDRQSRGDPGSHGGGGGDRHNAEPEDEGSDPDDIAVTPTVGTDFYSRVVRGLRPGISVRLQIWDTAGLDKYTAVTESTYRSASLVVCLFDVSNRASLDDVLARHLAQASEFIPDLEQDGIFVVANKIDLLEGGAERERARSQRRAAAPEAAFIQSSVNGGGNDASTDLPSSVGPGDDSKDDEDDAIEKEEETTIVSVKDVQGTVLDLFAEVHYAEVSARKRTGMSAVLRRMCVALLQNEGALTEDEESEMMDENGSFDLQMDSKLPKDSVGEVTGARGGATARAAATGTGSPSSPNSDGPPSIATTAKRESRTEAEVAIAAATATNAATATRGVGSWSVGGGFNFNMGSDGLASLSDAFNSTAIFSPRSLPPTPTEEQLAVNASMRGHKGLSQHADPHATSEAGIEAGVHAAAPVAAWRRGGGAKGPATAAPDIPANETRAERVAREKAELASLRGRSGGVGEGNKEVNPPEAAAPAQSSTHFHDSDLDAAEKCGAVQADENVATDAVGVRRAPRGRKFHSILDDLVAQRNEEEQDVNVDGPNPDEEDDDDAGANMHQRIQDRFAEIEKNRDLDDIAMRRAMQRDAKYGTNTAAELSAKRNAGKPTKSVTEMYKRKKRKAFGKCKCAVM